MNGGLNTYAYSAQNPVRYIDPYGLAVSAFGGGQVSGMFGPVGGSYADGGSFNLPDGSTCRTKIVCVRLGWGFYIGAGGVAQVSVGNDNAGSSLSIGVGGDIGAGPSAGGSVGVSGIGAPGANVSVGRGWAGGGFGISTGIDFCLTINECSDPDMPGCNP